MIKCRVCLINSTKANMVSLFVKNKNFVNKTIEVTNADLIMRCASVQLKQNDSFPQNICKSCYGQLLKAYQFKIRCERSDRLLHKQTKETNRLSWDDTDTISEDVQQPIYSCNKCFKDFTNKENLSGHFCRKQIENKDDAKQEKGDQKSYSCTTCLKNFASITDLNEHKTSQHKETCTQCSESVSDLLRHNFEVHRIRKCNSCKRRYLTYTNFWRHMQSGCAARKILNVDKRRYLCPDCGLCFKESANLKVHQRIHTGEKPYECEICKQRFTQWSTARAHRLSHTDKKDFACEICGKTFHLKYGLTKHIISHSEERKFSCEICEKKFKRLGTLKEHMTIHSGIKNYKCEICNKDFALKRKLEEHVRTHNRTESFVCKICSHEFTQIGSLRIHINAQHKSS